MNKHYPEVHVRKADTGRHLHDYYEGDVLQLYVDFPDAYRKKYGEIQLSDGQIQGILEHCQMTIGFGSEESFPANLVGPSYEGDTLKDFKVYWLWNTEGIRHGLYQMEVEFDDNWLVEIFEPAEDLASAARQQAAKNKKGLAPAVRAQ